MAFPAHSFAHAFVHYLVRHIVPVASLAFALFFYLVYAYSKENARLKLFWRLGWAFFLCVTLWAGVSRSGLPVTPDAIRHAKDFLVFKKCLLKLRKISNEKDLICTNYFRFPFMRFYTDRNILPAYDKASFEALELQPRFFIFLPRNSQGTIELYQLLNEKYKPIFRCESKRFPSMVFKVKE
jgi:hypothetical protein